MLYRASNGINMGDEVAGSVENMALSTVMYARLIPSNVAGLSLATLVITLLAALYPAWFAARLEPVEALHTV